MPDSTMEKTKQKPPPLADKGAPKPAPPPKLKKPLTNLRIVKHAIVKGQTMIWFTVGSAAGVLVGMPAYLHGPSKDVPIKIFGVEPGHCSAIVPSMDPLMLKAFMAEGATGVIGQQPKAAAGD
jgi:hypothetical protein